MPWRDFPHTPSTPEKLCRQSGEIIRHYSTLLSQRRCKFAIRKCHRYYGAKVILAFRTKSPVWRKYFVQRSTIHIKTDFDLEHLEAFLDAMVSMYRRNTN